MGLFHCPVGAAFYDDELCIDCGMCAATTKEERVIASKKIREYLMTVNAGIGETIRKITVCGKGGTGKSSIVALMSNALLKQGYCILVLDTDESNPGLYRILGLDKEPKPLMRLINRFSNDSDKTSNDWFLRDQISLDDIPEEYIVIREDLRFMNVGKILDPFEGCACSMADISREIVAKLVLGENEILLIDTEAGVESFGRGVERNVDTVIIVVEPSFESITLADKISYMAEGMGIKRIRALMNKVPSESTMKKMHEELKSKNIRSIGAIYLDHELSEAGFEGRPPGNSKASDDMTAITKMLLEEAG